MVRLSITCLFLAVYLSGKTQQLPAILTTDKYEKGIYRSFLEFLNNSPSIKEDFIVERNGFFDNKDFKIKFRDSTVRASAMKSFWGFSTGDSIFINAHNYLNGLGYIAMRKVDRYCYWKDRDTGEDWERVRDVVTGTISHSYRIRGIIMNINNGRYYALDKNVMYTILQNDSDLLKSYKYTPNKVNIEVMFSFIDMYNARHRHEIGKIDKDAKLVLYRRIKRERADTLTLVTPDSLTFKLAPNEFTSSDLPGRTIILCANNECREFVLTLSRTNYIECSFKTNEKKPTLTIQVDKVGELYIKEIQSLRQKQLREQKEN